MLRGGAASGYGVVLLKGKDENTREGRTPHRGLLQASPSQSTTDTHGALALRGNGKISSKPPMRKPGNGACSLTQP